MSTHETTPPTLNSPQVSNSPETPGKNSSNYSGRAGRSVPENISLTWRLDGSPHRLEQQLEEAEMSSKQRRVAVAAGKLVLSLGGATVERVESYIELGREAKRKAQEYYESVPESIKSLDLTTPTTPEVSASSEPEDDEDAIAPEAPSTEDAESPEPEASESGGEGPPEEPPTEEGVEDDSDDSSDDSTEAKRADTDSGGLSKDTEEQARLAHLRLETVRKAMEAGYGDPVDFLVKSRRNPNLVKQLESLGFDMSPPTESPDLDDDAGARAAHPFQSLNAGGQERGSNIVELTRVVGEKPAEARRRLRKISPPIPGVRNIHQRLLARRAFKHHRATRPKADKSGEPILYDDGLFGRGTKTKRAYRKRIQRVENAIAVERGKLNPLSHHELKALKTDRRSVAERILMLESMREAIASGRMVPEDFYDHQRFEESVKKYEGKT